MKGLYYDGKWHQSEGLDFIEVENPVTKKVFEKVIACNEQDIDRAVKSAKKAFPSWRQTPLDERIVWIKKLESALREKIDKLAVIIRSELGSGPEFSKDIHLMPYLNDMKNFCELVTQVNVEESLDNMKIIRDPVGVIACLTPWNFPFGQIEKKIIPALLMGNTIVLKPSQQAPLIAVELFNTIDEIGFPAGVINLTCGRGAEVGNALALHSDVSIITFTGSTEGGKAIAKLAASGAKRTVLELGGKSPSVILKGADLDLALDLTLKKIFYNTGQICSALSRLIAPIELKSEIENKIIEKAKHYPFATKENPSAEIGPLASQKQFDKVKHYIELGIEEGANLLVGEVLLDQNDYFVKPTVFTDVTSNMTIAQEEIFGPVLSVLYYTTKQEALAIANDVIYGLAGAVFGPQEEAVAFAKQIETGIVTINNGALSYNAPLGGIKQSGYGKEGGIHGLLEFTNIKTIFV